MAENEDVMKRLKLILLFCFFISTLLYAEDYQFKQGKQTACVVKEGEPAVVLPFPCKNRIPVDVYTPENVKIVADVLILNGWNFPRDDWQKKTRILKSAKQKGFRLIFPEMGKTVYESEYYPETKLKWSVTPGGKWVREILVPSLQNYGLLTVGKRNFVMGLSTGGRGAVLIGLTKSDVFKGVATLSGDFDQASMPKDNLMTLTYGAYTEFQERWETVDNAHRKASEWKLPIYIGHGQADKIVPFSQSKSFYEVLKNTHKSLKIIFNDPKTAGHDYKYWDAEVDPVFDFFSEIN